MRVLVLTAADRLPNLNALYGMLGCHLPIEVLRLSKNQQRHLGETLAGLDLSVFQRVLLDLPFRHIRGQARCLSGLAGLVIYEEDACQNYLEGSRYRGQFSRFYRRVPQARVVVTGAALAERLCAEGVAASFMAKGFDSTRLFAEVGPRDIELGFIGRTASKSYQQRKALLEQLAEVEPLQLLRTEPGDAYRHMLNRIQVFVSADIGLGEYMAKNFEAMACGCLVLAWRQRVEEAAIGLEEGKHLLLYSSLDELRGQLARLRREPLLLQSVAKNGQAFVEEHLTYLHLAARLSHVLQLPVRELPSPSGWRHWWSRLRA